MTPVGKINVYTCTMCGTPTVTVDRDNGVTPFMMGCPKCPGMAESAFYRVDQSLRPTHEWYSPDDVERRRLDKDTRDHVTRGGLLYRRIIQEPKQ